jgi:hypothetical protein
VNALETGDRLLMPERHGITWWPLARDTGGRNGSGLHAALGGRGMPITAFYDETGQLLDVDGGAVPEPVLRARLADLYGLGSSGDDAGQGPAQGLSAWIGCTAGLFGSLPP